MHLHQGVNWLPLKPPTSRVTVERAAEDEEVVMLDSCALRGRDTLQQSLSRHVPGELPNDGEHFVL